MFTFLFEQRNHLERKKQTGEKFKISRTILAASHWTLSVDFSSTATPHPTPVSLSLMQYTGKLQDPVKC